MHEPYLTLVLIRFKGVTVKKSEISRWLVSPAWMTLKNFLDLLKILQKYDFGATSDLYRLDFCFNKLEIWLKSSKPVI